MRRPLSIDLTLALALLAGCGASAASIRRDAEAVRTQCRANFDLIARTAPTLEDGDRAIAAEEIRCEAAIAEICDRPGDPCHD